MDESQLGPDVDKMMIDESEDKILKCMRCGTMISDVDGKIQFGICDDCHRTMYQLKYDSFLDKNFNSCIVCLDSLKAGNCLPKHDCDRVGVYICKFCDARFDVDSDFAGHLNRRMQLLETKKRLFSFCDLRSNRNKKVSLDLRVSSKKKKKVVSDAVKIPCNVCNKLFSKSSSLELHLKRTHFNENISDSDKHNRMNDTSNTTSNEVESYSNKQKPVNDSTPKLNRPVLLTDDKRYMCDLCDKSYTKSYNLIRHKQFGHSDEKQFQCDICNKLFKNPSSLMTHKRFVHSDERNHHCEICKKSFKNADVLKKHTLIHTDERKFQCHICYSSFRRLGTLSNHMLVHSNIRKFSCTVCNKSFKCSASLRNHMTLHSDDKKYVCNICNKSFKLPQQVTAHMVIHSDEKNFTCNICNKSFKRLFGLKGHMERHLKMKKLKKQLARGSAVHSVEQGFQSAISPS